MFKNIIVFVTALVAFAGLVSTTPLELQQSGLKDAYHKCTGNGSPGAGWPTAAEWGKFDGLWSRNLPLIKQSCGWNGWGVNNSPAEINNLKSAIHQVASSTGVDARFILLIIMQESKGCVRVPTTNNGVRNPGLMQSHNGSGTCQGVNPCPKTRIVQMIRDGTAGTSSGDGLKQVLRKTKTHLGGISPRAYYAAARLYNSGSVDYAHLENGFSSVACYASDIANRATGWTLAASKC